jgi:LPS sulfotransferase NodH
MNDTANAKTQKKGVWKDKAFQKQLSPERDFAHGTDIKFKYAICCGHRTGSNLLGEALYKTGHAGDPMEYFNMRFLKEFLLERGTEEMEFHKYVEEIKKRRTSPNGVFGINVKFDQLQFWLKDNWQQAIDLIKDNDYVLFLYRKDRLKQAISNYIARNVDLFNVPSDIDDDTVMDLVKSVPFSTSGITSCLNIATGIEEKWLIFFKNNNIKYDVLAYEDFIDDYEGHIENLLKKFNIPKEDRFIPEKPLKKVSNKINEEFRIKYLDFISGKYDPISDNG